MAGHDISVSVRLSPMLMLPQTMLGVMLSISAKHCHVGLIKAHDLDPVVLQLVFLAIR